MTWILVIVLVILGIILGIGAANFFDEEKGNGLTLFHVIFIILTALILFFAGSSHARLGGYSVFDDGIKGQYNETSP